ncbi:uncharacterized protein LOC125419100 isoform X2 [Ziziphus jujuba]|uniref:Uncharacterized protein LOC125419100 isoform X2 n=1 Tax=Ziziphus jujuba TaxID=326968 RepID=A0ABM4ACK6_ZIZJJ|nr:uncharacterized protein LOC125419100 isoform X2 [Ziziphus jujuba]
MFSKLNLPIFAGFLFFWRVVFGGVELVAVNSHLVFTIQFLNSEVNEVRISIPSWKRKRLAWRSIYHMVPQQQKGGLATGALQRLACTFSSRSKTVGTSGTTSRLILGTPHALICTNMRGRTNQSLCICTTLSTCQFCKSILL